ncbi:MAG: hypothetical protein HC853_11225 [Anaerolineae bacterium]|nr:hypothetical protein [Anaerolineae bacterium]
MALTYLNILRIKRLTEAKSRGHVVLAPCPTAPMMNAFKVNTSSSDPYWTNFYSAVRDGVNILVPNPIPPQYTSQQESGISPQSLKALHLHYYSSPRDTVGNPPPTDTLHNLPLEAVAEGAYLIKGGVNEFRKIYYPNNPNQPLDMDVLLSEMGADWRIMLDRNFPKYKWAWAGGWNNFRDGLSWWNSWLCWLMRRAPLASELNLANCPTGTKTDAHALYACLHSADLKGYSTQETSDSTTMDGQIWFINGRNQYFFNADSWTTGIAMQMESIVSNHLMLLPSGRFSNSFTALYPTAWDNNTQYRIGPLGACYKVWSQIASDLNTTTYGAGWYSNSTAGTNIGETTVDIPGQPGGLYSTIYFPIIKSFGTFPSSTNTRFSITWRQSGRPDYAFGYFDANEFPNSKAVTQIWTNELAPFNYGPKDISSQPQTIYSAMIFPVVCRSSTPQTVTLRLSRNIGGTSVSLGRPIVLRQACSWLTDQ